MATPSAPPADLPPAPGARGLALELVEAVLLRRRPLDEALEATDALARLEPRDRAFVRLLVATVLRRRGQIDDALNSCLGRKLTPKAARQAQDLLRLGAAQLLFLKTPPHAAVDRMVALATGRRRGYAGLTNAVLRRLAREGEGLIAAQDAERLNTPDWLGRSWSDAYGEATARAIAAVHAAEPPLDLSLKGEPGDWAERLGAETLPTGTLRRPAALGGAVAELPGYAEGAWWVQDAAASLPARLLGPVAGLGVIELGAAPGGKTAQLAAAGGRVVALDRSAQRLERLRANLHRLGLTAETLAADATTWRPAEPATHVLLDAPCSATGTLRRHPDIAWLKDPEDLPALVATQSRLLKAAVEMLAPGGILVYAVCSLEPAEGVHQIDKLLVSGAPVARRPIAADEIGGLAQCLTEAGDLRTLPCHLAPQGGLDGFYAARLVRR